jgi:hypothetical protein
LIGCDLETGDDLELTLDVMLYVSIVNY